MKHTSRDNLDFNHEEQEIIDLIVARGLKIQEGPNLPDPHTTPGVLEGHPELLADYGAFIQEIHFQAATNPLYMQSLAQFLAESSDEHLLEQPLTPPEPSIATGSGLETLGADQIQFLSDLEAHGYPLSGRQPTPLETDSEVATTIEADRVLNTPELLRKAERIDRAKTLPQQNQFLSNPSFHGLMALLGVIFAALAFILTAIVWFFPDSPIDSQSSITASATVTAIDSTVPPETTITSSVPTATANKPAVPPAEPAVPSEAPPAPSATAERPTSEPNPPTATPETPVVKTSPESVREPAAVDRPDPVATAPQYESPSPRPSNTVATPIAERPATATPTASNTVAPTNTPTNTPQPSPTVPTPTDTAVPTPTGTAVPTETPGPTPCPERGYNLDVVLLLDRSGSISTSGAQQLVIDTALGFVSQLDYRTDRAGLVTFNHRADLEQRITSELQLLEAEIAGLTFSGGTNIADGITLAATELRSAGKNREAVPVIVMLTDGQAKDDRDAKRAVDAATLAKAHFGIRIVTIGLGQADRTLLERIASPGDIYYAEEADRLEEIYTTIYQTLTGPAPCPIRD
ncbi:MAG: VWA domain-containing protein [Oscillochloris sp.]|nr:VWA domain-containing protein [Oscillochloris sp.]